MAERQRFPSSDYRKQASPDAVYDNECDACRFEGTVSEGTSFCNVCKEFLCDECKRMHRKSQATKDHDLVDGDSLYTVQHQGQHQPFEICLLHPDKVVDFFCATHDSVFCADCRVTEHGSCRRIESVSKASAGIQSSREAEKFAEKIQSMNARITDLCDERIGCLAQLDQDKQEFLHEITYIRDGINTLLDRLEKEMRQTVISTITKETNKVQNELSALNTFKTSLERDMKHLDVAKSTRRSETMFLAMKRAGLQAIEAPLDAIDKEQFIIKMEFTAHHLLQEILSSLQTFGSLKTKSIKRPTNLLPASLRERSLVEVAERDVQQGDDKSTCTITGSVFLPRDKSLICDFANSKVKLLNKELTVEASVKLNSGPWDVAMVTEQECVVSLPVQKKLQYVTVPGLKSGLKPGRKFKIGKPGYGLAVHKDQIFVACHNNPGNAEILVLNKDGAIQRRIGRTGQTGRTYMFTVPDYIAVDAFGEKVYVSDRFEHSVTCLTVEGEPVYHCVLEEAVHARSMLLDSEGGVFVCCEETGTSSLEFLTPDGNQDGTLMTWPLETWNPLTLCYRSRDRTLLVGMCDNNKILVYRFE